MKAGKSQVRDPIPLILIAVLLCPFSYGKTIYVDDDAIGANDGSSWENAYVYLQDALADANTAEKPVEIHVAQGIYKPDQGVNRTLLDRKATFQLVNGASLKGGYAGFGEHEPNNRDIETYETILSGDIYGDDVYVDDPSGLFDEPTRKFNSRNVVTSRNTDATAVLEGVTITGGYIWVIIRNGGSAGGAGMLVDSGSPRIIDCTFTENVTGNAGGGILIYDNSNPTLINCKFTRNYAREGGGIWNSTSNPILFDCIFENNYALRKGGGISNRVSNPELTNCTFRRNRAVWLYLDINISDGDGGGIYNRNSSPVLTNCTFSNNAASRGGAIYNKDSNNSMNTCGFVGNTCSMYGGAICSDGGQQTIKGCVFENNFSGAVRDYSTVGSTFDNCTFRGNSSQRDGAAVYFNKATFNHCLFVGNVAFGSYWNDIWYPSLGGAVFNMNTAVFKNCTFFKNWAEYGDAIYDLAMGEVYVDNCIFRGSENQIYVEPYWPMFVRYSNIQGGREGEGNIDVDPLFVEPGYWGHIGDTNVVVKPNDPNAVWVDGDYHLKSEYGRWDPKSESWVVDDVTSPCIDAGDPNSPVGDEPEPNGGRINIGAYGGTAEASKSP